MSKNRPIMKKNIAIVVFLAAFVFVISSCGTSKHGPCPAYGSTIDNGDSEYLIASVDE